MSQSVMIQICVLTFTNIATVTMLIVTSVIRLFILTICLCFVVFFRFGLSNRFDTEFPSVLTGKVLSLFYFFPLALQSCSLLSVHFQVERIKQLKPQ